MHRIGDTVIHKDYPLQLGRVVAKHKSTGLNGAIIYLVKWDRSGDCSRHIGFALNAAFKKL